MKTAILLGLIIGVFVAFIISSAFLLRIMTPPSTLQDEDLDSPTVTRAELVNSLDKLLRSVERGQRGGFIIFSMRDEAAFIQYSLEPNGLILNWPTFQEGGKEKLLAFRRALGNLDFSDVTRPEAEMPFGVQIGRLKYRELVIADDGLYAQCGTNASEIAHLTELLAKKVFSQSGVTSVQIETAPP